MDRFEASLHAPVGSAIVEADTRIIQRPGWYQLVTPSVKEASMNEVIFSIVPSADVEQRIDEAFSLYARHDLPFKWCIGPMSSPGIEPRLAPKAGASWHFRGMAIDSAHEISASAEVAVERVNSGNFEDFLRVFTKGWSLEKLEDAARKKLDLSREGISFAVTQARDATSAPILEKLGFETMFRAKIYQMGG